MNSTEQTIARSPTPIDPERRIEALDMIRGFALFGILLVHVFNFGAHIPFAWNEPVDEFAFSVMHVFFETKSWRLFSFLFGFGFALQMIRAEERGAKFAAVYLRRLIILFVIGAGNMAILPTDILMLYAELGLLLVLFRNFPPKLLLVLCVCLLAVFPIGRAVTSYLEPVQTTPIVDYAARIEIAMAELEERRTNVKSVGSMPEVLADNFSLTNPFDDFLGPESSLAMFAMFILGLYVGRRRIFQDIPKHMQLIRRVFWWGFPIGLVSMGVERVLNATMGYEVFLLEQRTTLLPQLLGDVLFTYGSTALALSYAAGITLLAQHHRGRRVLAPLGAAGRMSLTVYLSGPFMLGILFYGFAFGNAYRLGPAEVTAYAVLFFAIDIVFAVWWMKRFRFGPMEWLWRGLTYLKFPPIRLQK